MQQLFPEQRPIAVPGVIYDDLVFPAHSDRPYVIANMVSSVDGKAQLRGSAAGIGSRLDHTLLLHLRGLGEAVMLGAGTIRADKPLGISPPEVVAVRVRRGLAPQPRWVLVTRSGDLPGCKPLLRAAEQRPVVLVPAGMAADRTRQRFSETLDVVELDTTGGSSGFVAALVTLRERYHVHLLLCEGGPTILRQLFADRLLDELFLTLGPKILGGAVKTIVNGDLLGDSGMPLELVTAYEDASELFFRYKVG